MENENDENINDIENTEDTNPEKPEKPEKPENPEEKTIQLQLGDIIQITDPTNDLLNKQNFLIDYIDSRVIKLVNLQDFTTINLKIKRGSLVNDNIESISLIQRNDMNGYARQNGLLPRKWVNIYFGGDTPVIITGQITNLEEDMIEITTYPDNETIYINFGYKGIPEDLPIETIEIREKPTTSFEEEREKREMGEEMGEELGEELGQELGVEMVEEEGEEKAEEGEEAEPKESERTLIDDENQHFAPLPDVKNVLKEFIIKANEIQFGETLDAITQMAKVDSSQQRYNIETQTNDLLEELLSKVPNYQRTTNVLRNIHTMIERFQQLREQFSVFDKNGTIEKALKKESSWKPLVDDLNQLKTLLYWILPVSKNIKKVYNAFSENETSDTSNLTLSDDLENISAILETYKSSNVPDDQNKYAALYSDLNPYFTPFDDINPESRQQVITEKEVEANLNIIIDNLNDFNSSIVKNDIVKTRRFVIQKYNLGLSRLQTTPLQKTHVVKLTQPDTAAITSILTLPEPAIRFSHINLPSTNILEKANLNSTFLTYWQFLKKNTVVNHVAVDDFSQELEFSEDAFADAINHFTLSENIVAKPSFKEFLNVVIPKTRVLFKMMKKYIRGKLTIHNIVSFLEPFLVYNDDLTYKQYQDMNHFLYEKISEYNKNYIEGSKKFAFFKTVEKTYSKPKNASAIVGLLTDAKDTSIILQDYNYTGKTSESDEIGSTNMTSSELLTQMILRDFAKLYDTAVSQDNSVLMLPENISALLDNRMKELGDDENKGEMKQDEKCQTFVIAKQYNTLEELTADNEKTIYFDKKYDDTMYGYLEKFEKEQIKLSPKEFYEFLVDKLQGSLNLPLTKAEDLAESLIRGMKKVEEGNYAIFFDSQENKIQYYKRTANTWIFDKEASETMFVNNSNMLCNFQKNCIEVQDKYNTMCESFEINKKFVMKDAMNDIVNEFDKNYQISKEQLEVFLQSRMDYYLGNIERLEAMENTNKFKYNKEKYQLSITDDSGDKAEEILVSPFFKLRDLILGQANFIKKQNDIVRFCQKYTREANPISLAIVEDPHWRYCIQSNAKLIPLFLFVLAISFVEEPNHYLRTMEEVIKENGALSDDGDAWVDKYSGYIIKRIDFDVDEGYEEGFKKKTRDVLEGDEGDAITNDVGETEKNMKKVDTPETKMVKKIIRAFTDFMGIRLEHQHEFILQIVSNALPLALPRESDYKIRVQENAKRGKQTPPYQVIYNITILFLTLGAVLIGIQTSIPSIKTRKTFPGCVRSFDGFPLEGAGDYSGMNYLACIAFKIEKRVEPYQILSKMSETDIAARIKLFIENYYLNDEMVKRKFQDKTYYLVNYVAGEQNIAQEHQIERWTGFLPPLVPFKMKSVSNISNEFKKSLLSDLKCGSVHQREKIMTLVSKMIQFSFEIQYKIQKIVNKKTLLLANSANEPFLENSCCNENGQFTTMQYFEKEDPEIYSDNNYVGQINDMLDDILAYTKSPFLFCRENSKNIYPALDSNYNEETIYQAFIVLCKFKSLIPVRADLLPFCSEKPDFSLKTGDSLGEIIKKLKQDGRIYDQHKLLRLLQVVARNNIVELSLDKPVVTQVDILRHMIDLISVDTNASKKIFPEEFAKLLMQITDAVEIHGKGSKEKKDTENEFRNLRNFLGKKNQELRLEIFDYIKKNASLNDSDLKVQKNILLNLMKWDTGASVETETENQEKGVTRSLSKSISFVKQYIDNFLNVFPSIIMNKIVYSNVKLPKYWDLSNYHNEDIKKNINDYYAPLKSFYDDQIINPILTAVGNRSRTLFHVMRETPMDMDERTLSLLFEYYFLQTLQGYIQMSEEEAFIMQGKFARENSFLEDEGEGVEDTGEMGTEKALSISGEETLALSENLKTGNKKNMRIRISKLISTFLKIANEDKITVDLSYETVMDAVFKSKEREKDTFTDRLKDMTDESRKVDTELKINKLGAWSKGLQKGLTIYTAENYDEEREEMEKLATMERIVLRNKNTAQEEGNMDIYLDDFADEMRVAEEIEREEYDMGGLTEDYMDGDYFGGEEENWGDYE